jgi:hypothetical protein
MATPIKFMYPKLLEKTGSVPGAAKKNIAREHTAGAPKWMIPYGNHARTSRMTN